MLNQRLTSKALDNYCVKNYPLHMETTGTIRLGDENFEFPIIEGTEGEKALDTRTLRAKSGCITFDEGYGNTGSCQSDISFIDG